MASSSSSSQRVLIRHKPNAKCGLCQDGMQFFYGAWSKCDNCGGTGQVVKRPPFVVLCGSIKAALAFFESENLRLTREGYKVLSIGVHKTDESLGLSDDDCAALDELHLFKIDDVGQDGFVYFLNAGGYLGKSSLRELAYAYQEGKPIRFLEPAKVSDYLPYATDD